MEAHFHCRAALCWQVVGHATGYRCQRLRRVAPAHNKPASTRSQVRAQRFYTLDLNVTSVLHNQHAHQGTDTRTATVAAKVSVQSVVFA